MTRRWVCPKCDAGCLAPSRPRKDDVRRFCLPCSAKTGRLVERVCPAADNAKARELAAQQAKREANRAATQAKRVVEREQLAVARSQESAARRALRALPIAELAKMTSRQAYEEAARRYAQLKAWEKDLTGCKVAIRFSASKAHTSGHAFGGNGKGRFVVTVGTDCADAHVTILHELAHVAAPVAEWHGTRWRLFYLAAASEVVGHRIEASGNLTTVELDRHIRRELALFLYGGGVS